MNVRKCLFFEGIVQGVGFRPFLWRLAERHGLAGFVRNRADGVVAEVEGPAAAVASFLAGISEEPPPLAEILRITETEIPPRGATGEGFVIAASDAVSPWETHISPDRATCPDCLTELFDPKDRRFGYPFINCTNCGPRLTIIAAVPYDRARTAMACFPLCPDCRREYEDPADRRFHAEPNACPVCGPHLQLRAAGDRPLEGDPFRRTLDLLAAGAIVAVKGLGGFHLCCDAQNDGAVATLRARKHREEKPLAIMVRDLAAATTFAEVGPAEARLLTSPERPIVLLPRRAETTLSPRIAPGTNRLGIMLPYTPLHHLLLAGPLTALVMTSGNRTDEPICTGNREALHRLAGIADAFLVHNRDILVRCDDSVVATAGGGPYPLRRARGYAPKPVPLAQSYPEILALGPQIKGTVCLLRGRFAFLSPHVGDLETPEARDFLLESVALMERITHCRPALVACDLHPQYHTSRVARTMTDRRVVAVQHHHAHIVSCMAEHGLDGEVIGLAMDGTGFGSDGQVWGGEFLVASEGDFRRRGHLRYLPLPGGEQAIREPWRMAAALLKETFGTEWPEQARRLDLLPPSPDGPEPESLLAGIERAMATGIRTPRTSSLGRLFDGVAALLGLNRRAGFEGQAAMALEALAEGSTDWRLPFAIAAEDGATLPSPPLQNEPLHILDLRPALRAIVEARLAGCPRAEIALAFHDLLPEAFTAMATRIRRETGLRRIVLSGGCFQNHRLLAGCLKALQEAGFATFHHRLVPPNDGGIALGQAVCAGARQRKE